MIEEEYKIMTLLLVYMLIALISITVGFIAGLIFTSKFYKNKESYILGKDGRVRSARAEMREPVNHKPGAEGTLSDNINKDYDSRAHKRISSLADKSSSWAQFNDDMDGISDHSETLRKMREEEDDAYNYLNTIIKNRQQ